MELAKIEPNQPIQIKDKIVEKILIKRNYKDTQETYSILHVVFDFFCINWVMLFHLQSHEHA